MERVYYQISESLAMTAKHMNSFSEYQKGSATEEYKAEVDAVYDVVEKIAEEKPHLLERATAMAERYSRKLAEYYNAYYRNEASCPSIMISGGGNFPVRKKEKQNRRRDSLFEQWEWLEEYANKIRRLLTMEQPILSKDENAIELLEAKVERLTAEQEKMKAANAYYRKHKTLDGCPELTPEEIEERKASMANDWHLEDKPYQSFLLQNNNATIKNTKARLENLQQAKERGNTESENEFFKVVENTDIMRLQLFFDGKPDAEVRSILKSNGFKWAPSQEAWQRQLTNNARYSLKRVLEELKEMKEAQ